MRLLSFCNQVETTLAMLRPEDSTGWRRRADYQTGSATCWHVSLGLTLVLRCCALADERFSLQTSWHGPAGQELFARTFFCGASVFDWQAAADAVAEAMPEPVLQSASPAPRDSDPAADTDDDADDSASLLARAARA